MNFDISDFVLDERSKNEGVWTEFPGGAELRIASLDRKAFTEAFRKETKSYTDMGLDIPTDVQEDIMNKLLGKYILLDWKNVFEDGKEIPYSEEVAVRIMQEIPFIRDKVLERARKIGNYRRKADEDIEGN